MVQKIEYKVNFRYHFLRLNSCRESLYNLLLKDNLSQKIHVKKQYYLIKKKNFSYNKSIFFISSFYYFILYFKS